MSDEDLDGNDPETYNFADLKISPLATNWSS